MAGRERGRNGRERQQRVASGVRLRDGSGRAAYPWMRHFHRGYPTETVAAWVAAWGELEPDPRGLAPSAVAGTGDR